MTIALAKEYYHSQDNDRDSCRASSPHMKVSNGRQLRLEQVPPAAEPTVEIPAFPLVRDPLLLSSLSLSVLLLVIITIISSGNPQKKKDPRGIARASS